MRGTLGYNTVFLSVAIFFINSISFSQDAIITGVVRHGNEFLQGATIKLGDKTTITDHNGKFSLPIKAGSYTIIVTHTGYKKIEQILIEEAGITKNVEFEMIPVGQLEEVIMLGSRSKIQRSNLNTPVPIDVFSSGKLVETGQVSLTQMLNFAAPSFNASREVLHEPATLRGLDPNHVLILVNGIRYHNMVSIFSGNLLGQLGRGSVSNDLNSIPFSAIEKIELLRDGASAQYGSDAIAGVINIILKESFNKTSIRLHTGQFYKGDGEKFLFGINHGIPLNKRGFLNFSADFRYQQPTLRGGQYDGTVYKIIPTNAAPDASARIKAEDDSIINARGFNRRNAVDNVGNSKFIVGGLLVNGAYKIADHAEIFWTAAYNKRKTHRNAQYRFPKNPSQVILELYPDGFQVKSNPNTVDVSTIAGIRGKTKKNWRWDLTSSFGSNAISSYVTNTNNASQFSLGKDAQTSFYSGKTVYNQLVNNINFAKGFAGLQDNLKSVNLGWGIEWRLENFREKEGEKASWQNYDPTYRTQAGAQGGGSTDTTLFKTRHESGAYIDLEAELNDHFLIDIAGRYEYYSDFGGNFAGKLSARYKFSDKFSLRGSISNGFRAPSLQQRYNSSVASGLYNVGSVLIPLTRGIFPNDHEVIKALGIPSLTAEKTINVSGGLTATILKHINVTIDAYWIQIKNRIVLSGTFDRRTNSALDALLDNYSELNQVDRVAFFCNGINTRTSGIDIVANGNWHLNKSNLGFTLAANFNRTRLFGEIKATDQLPSDSLNTNSLFNTEEITKVEKGQPGSKIILSITWEKGKTKFILNNTRFGKTVIAPLNTATGKFLYESFSPKILTDFSIHYSLRPWLAITAGVNNVFNVYPDLVKHYENTSQGIYIYSPEASPFGFNGGYYFAGMSFNF